jgi:hypothetical protein
MKTVTMMVKYTVSVEDFADVEMLCIRHPEPPVIEQLHLSFGKLPWHTDVGAKVISQELLDTQEIGVPKDLD